LHVDWEITSPREWEQWLAAIGKAISKHNLIGHRGKGTLDEFRLVHVSRYRRVTGTLRKPVLLQT
jgi:hypothetical protein